MQDFTKQSMFEIYQTLQELLKTQNKISFTVLNPDFLASSYAGEVVKIENEEFIYRSFNSYVDLALLLDCKILTPKYIDEKKVSITLEKVNKIKSFHNEDSNEEKYGALSTFNQINKNEEPDFLINYIKCLENTKISSKKKVLNLGVNSAGEFEVIKQLCENFNDIEFVGVDYSSSAITLAKEKFKENSNVKFFAHDINKLEQLDLGKFDLIISIGTLQSSNMNFNETFMNIVQNYMEKNAAMIIGFPNCRWHDGQMIYGAKAKNYSFSEMSVLYKDAMFCKKYLQQKKFRVTLTGKNYIFLTATSIRK
ncbi:methyltransferase domain-containing protein [Malaciobacter halophilus]|jgi:SAM-dependent methyltransferase|uniref:methyltransferase domain-containing protein n=1 Tax=Malaciobacter canalis TaxID=1912871 RepID=UPI001010808A|nr:methyltransferase domain-containing protein [Malaciobacter halophilus]RYA24832.1 methyltransferase [Malaciobacter halophilus]